MTSAGGLILVRELDERCGLSDLIAQYQIGAIRRTISPYESLGNAKEENPSLARNTTLNRLRLKEAR